MVTQGVIYMGDKKEEQLKIIEMMNDARKDLEARYARLKVLLDEEEAGEKDYLPENQFSDQPDKESGKQLNKQQLKQPAVQNRSASSKLLSRMDSSEKKRIRKEMGTVQVQIDYVKAAIEICEQQLKQAKDKEEKKKIENVMKGVMLIGAYNEIKRMSAEKEKKDEAETEIIKTYEEVLEEKVKEIFVENKFRYVTQDKVEEILKNEEFKTMAEKDPTKLKRVEKDIRQEYENTMIRCLSYIGEEIGDNFKENEEKFNKKFLSVSNGFEAAYKVLKDDIRFQKDERYEYEKGKRKKYTKELAQYGSDEDKKFFKEIMQEVDELAIQTRDLQNEFLLGRSNFIKGNGYTKELIEREQNVLNRLKEYKEAKNNDSLKDVEEGRDPTGSVQLMSLALEFIFPIEQQLGRDVVMQMNNELRQKMEMWYIYERLPKDSEHTVKKVSEKVDNELKAWSKLQRMKRNAVGLGEIRTNLSDWAVENAAMLLARMKNPAPFTKEDEKTISLQFAAIVLSKVVDDEAKKKIEGPESYYAQVMKAGNRENFVALAEKLSVTKEFKNAMKKYVSKNSIREDVIKFLANDVEDVISKSFTGRNAEHRRMSMMVETGQTRPRSNAQKRPKRKN